MLPLLALVIGVSAPNVQGVGEGVTRSSDGVAIHYHVEGQGSPALVFVHCWACDRHLWDAVVPVFATSHRVVTLDLAGHGESGRDRKAWTIEAYGDDVRAVVEALKLDHIVLIGHSMGGPVIVEAARKMPDRVVGLVPVDTLLDVSQRTTPEQADTFLKPLEADFKGGTEKFIREYMFVPTSDKALVERVVAMAQAAPPEVALPSLRNTWLYDAEGALRDVKAPIHAINGDKFPTNLEAERKVAPQFDAVIMKGVGHYLMLEDPGRFNTLLAGILKALPAPSEGGAARHKEE